MYFSIDRMADAKRISFLLKYNPPNGLQALTSHMAYVTLGILAGLCNTYTRGHTAGIAHTIGVQPNIAKRLVYSGLIYKFHMCHSQ